MSWRKTHLSQTRASKNLTSERSHVSSLRVKLLAHAFSNSGPTHGRVMAIKAMGGETQERERMFEVRELRNPVNFHVFGTHLINILHMFSTPNLDDVTMKEPH